MHQPQFYKMLHISKSGVKVCLVLITMRWSIFISDFQSHKYSSAAS